jgi:hypothetical protein
MYILAVENALSHGVATEVESAKLTFYGVSSFHGMADSSLRQGQARPSKNGLRDKTWIFNLLFFIFYLAVDNLAA